MIKQFVQVFKCQTGIYMITPLSYVVRNKDYIHHSYWNNHPLLEFNTYWKRHLNNKNHEPLIVKHWFDSLLWISESRTKIWLTFINLTVFFVYSIHRENNESLRNPWQNRIDEFNLNARHHQRTNSESAILNIILNFKMDAVASSELYIDWNANSISAALWLGEAKIPVAGGSHERMDERGEWLGVRTRVYCRRETNLFAIEAFSGELLV